MTVLDSPSSSSSERTFLLSEPQPTAAPAGRALPSVFGEDAACGEGADAGVGTLTHCGRPMEVRRLNAMDPWCQANRAVLEAAVAGDRVHVCSCGHLQHRPAGAASEELVCSPEEFTVFHALFLRRVLVAAGTLETAEWSFDQVCADVPAAGGTAERWVLEADAESASWARDAARLALDAELRLAAAHGVSPASLAEAAALPQQQVERLVSSSTKLRAQGMEPDRSVPRGASRLGVMQPPAADGTSPSGPVRRPVRAAAF